MPTSSASRKKPAKASPSPPYCLYAEDVVAGRVLACRKTILAAKRFLADYAKAKGRGGRFAFDAREVEEIGKLVSLFVQMDDRFAGKRLELRPFQWFIIANLFGFKRRSDNTRRFRKAYISTARQNGKSFLIACFAIVFLLSSNGGQIYSAATTREQARITLDHARGIVDNTPELSGVLETLTNTIICKRKASAFRALSSDIKNKDGKSPVLAIFDEVGAYRTCSLINVLESGMKSKSEFLSVYITTANQWSSDQAGFLTYEYAGKVLEGELEDEEFFACIWELDSGDNWKEAKHYAKANPNLGLVVKIEDIEKSIQDAINRPELEWELRTKIANNWQRSSQAPLVSDDAWMTAAANWKKYGATHCTAEALAGAPVGIGVDLAGRNDLACFSKAFYIAPLDCFYLVHDIFIPSGEIENKIKNDSIFFRKWIELGLVKSTPAPVNDMATIAEEIARDIDFYSCRFLFYDPKMSRDVIDRLEGVVDVVPIPQTLDKLSEPTKDFQELILRGKIIDGNPVARWCINNTVLYQSSGMIKANKATKDSPKKIDVVISSIMALWACKEAIKAGARTEAPARVPSKEILSILYGK